MFRAGRMLWKRLIVCDLELGLETFDDVQET